MDNEKAAAGLAAPPFATPQAQLPDERRKEDGLKCLGAARARCRLPQRRRWSALPPPQAQERAA